VGDTFAALQTAAEISKTAIDNSDQLAVEAVDLFLALIGAEAGHMGLRSLASGGIYICGGIMPKVSQHCWTIVTPRTYRYSQKLTREIGLPASMFESTESPCVSAVTALSCSIRLASQQRAVQKPWLKVEAAVLAVQLLEKIKLGGVLDSYLHEKSRFNKLLKTFPLYVVLNEGLGLLGTREYAIRLVQTPEVCK